MANHGNKNRVLLVDDDPIARSLMATQLSSTHHHLTEAEDGEVAWRLLTSERFDVAIVDLNMPKLDGFELIRCIRGFPRTRHLPIVVVTSVTDASAISRALELGATSFLSKPLDWRAFRPHINFLLKLTGDARSTREQLHHSSAVSRAKDLLVAGFCSDVIASAERILTCARQASLRPVGAAPNSVLPPGRLQAVMDETATLINAACSTQNFIHRLSQSVNIGNEVVPVRDIVHSCLDLAHPQALSAGVQLIFATPTIDVAVSCNKQAVEFAIHELLTNAIRHAGRGSTASLSVKVFPDGLVVFEVCDDGIGMLPEFVANKLMPPADAQGGFGNSGHGWPVTKAIAEAHNGSFEVRSMPAQGTSAFFILPQERVRTIVPEDDRAETTTCRRAG